MSHRHGGLYPISIETAFLHIGFLGALVQVLYSD